MNKYKLLICLILLIAILPFISAYGLDGNTIKVDKTITGTGATNIYQINQTNNISNYYNTSEIDPLFSANFTLYSKYWYNMTTPFTDWLSTFVYNYNQTTPAQDYCDANLSNYYTKSQSDANYSAILWGYNMTTSFTNWLATFYYNYNQTTPAISYADTKAGTGDCPAGQVVQNTTTSGVECTTAGGSVSFEPVYLANDVTSTSSTAWSSVFSIPLTQNKLNIIRGHLATMSAKSGDSYSIGFNYSTGITTATNGTCKILQELTASTQSLDWLNPIGGAVVETGETANLCLNFPCDTEFTCDLNVADATNLNVWLQGETTTKMTVSAGSFYQIYVNT